MDRTNVQPLTAEPNTFATANITGALASSAGQSQVPFQVVRSWTTGQTDESIKLSFNFTNTGTQAIQLGGVGFVQNYFNNWTQTTIDETYQRCVVVEPSINSDGGYVQVTRVNGASPSLLIAPATNSSTPLQQWRKVPTGPQAPTLYADPSQIGITYEGMYKYMINNGGFTQDDEQAAAKLNVTRGDDWNTPEIISVSPGSSKIWELEFFTSELATRILRLSSR